MTAPEPRANPLLLGHAAAEATIAAAMGSGRMHHAWLITGPDGVGKATLAFRFARRLLAGIAADGEAGLDLPPSHPVFRRVAAASHADLLTIERGFDARRKRERRDIGVDEVRKVSDFLRLTPAEGGWRVVIVDGAEQLNRNAANALLKVLEEPPSRAVLLLTCSAPGRLPATLRSRCLTLRVTALGEADMHTLLARYLPDLDAAARRRLIAIADGAPGRALDLAEGEGLKLAALVDATLAALPGLPGLRAYEIADGLGRGEDAFSTYMDILRGTLAMALRETLRGRADAAQARLAGLRPLDAWGETWHALTRLQDETERFSLDKRQAVVAALDMLRGSNASTG